LDAETAIWLRELITPWDVYLHGASRIVHAERTPYQELCIVDTPAFGKKLFLDGIVQSSQADEFMYHEVLVQPAMFATGAARRVLVLGGGEGATLREALAWSTVARAVMVDLDGAVIAAARVHLTEWHRGSFDDPRTELVIGDAVEYLATTAERFDVVVSDMTDPVEDGPATFCFTAEYFEAVHNVLEPGGVLAVQAGPWSPVEIALHARVLRTMASVFPYVHSYPCNAPVYGRALGFAVASDEPIAPRVASGSAASAGEPQHLRYCTRAVAAGLLAEAPFVRHAIQADDRIYTRDAPPVTHGSAGWT
jgi:spermidine synthase